MKFRFARGAGSSVWFPVLGIIAMTLHCGAQDNSWTSPTSGNWEDASWSLGVVPGTNQNVLITNAGWKAVQIGAGTAQNFPLSLNVNSIVISSPTNSFNTLILNYAGSAPPLTVRTLSVASNSAVRMVSSALQINGPNGTGMAVGGEFDQNDSVVAGSQINVGYTGSGVYNFNSGYFTVSQLWLGGGAMPGVFNQNGGTNGFGITHLDGGTYVLSNGWYGATIYFNGGQFDQYGGILATDLTVFEGGYVLAGGVHVGAALVPSANAFTTGWGSMTQTGGTNEGSLDIGSYGGGNYTMSNGVSVVPSLLVDDAGSYSQFNGVQTIAGAVTINEAQVNYAGYEGGYFNLYGGKVSASGMFLSGYYTQTGGTNAISGDMTMDGFEDTRLSVSGGLLTMSNLYVRPAYVGGVLLTGGTVVITNTLTLEGNSQFPEWNGFLCGDGQLVVSNIFLWPAAIFSCGNGGIVQSGTLTLANANFYSATNSVQLGALCLASGGNTNSTLYMVSPTSVVSFGNSSSMTWSNGQMLMVEGWSGSLFGGGQQQIVFGNSAGGLTSAQLTQIQFDNPAGLAGGTYPAKILASGEIVPDSGTTAKANMAIAPQPSGMRLTLQGQAGRNYNIEVSTDMVHWVPWTNITANTNGAMSVMDCDATNCPARFYRARLLP